MNAKRLLFILLSIILGAVFIYSAWTKLETLQKFEYTIVEYVHFSWLMAAVSARLLIGLEAGLGFLMVTHLYGKNKIVLQLATAILLIFSIYLVFLWANVGNDVNCGCFGDTIMMTPLESLIKNAAMLIGIGLLIKFHRGFNMRIINIVALLCLIVITTLPMFIYALPDTEPTWLKKERFELDMSSLYAPDKTDIPKENLREGKHIISFFSLKCPHCKMAAYKMHLMKLKNPDLPFFMVLAGNKKNMPTFWKETKAQSIPYTTLEADTFTNLVGWSWPVIYYVKNGWVEGQINYISLDQGEIEKWVAQP